MKKLFSAAVFFLAFAGYSSEPLLRAGIITDTHICNSFKADFIICAGDIAHVYDQQGYSHYRDTIHGVFSAGDLPYDSGACQTGKRSCESGGSQIKIENVKVERY